MIDVGQNTGRCGVELKLSTGYNFEGWVGYPNPPNGPLSGANVYTIITVESSGGNGSDLGGTNGGRLKVTAT